MTVTALDPPIHPNFAGMKILPTLVLGACSLFGNAQDVTGFLDYKNRLYVFDKGEFKELESQRPFAFKAGGNYLAYASYNGDIRIYHDGIVDTLDRTTAIVPTVTDNFMGYTVAGSLKIFDGKELHTVCRNTNGSVVEDSVAGYYDEVNRTLNAFYRGKDYLLEDALATSPVQNWRAGDNILAWVTTFAHKFKVFYGGEIYELASGVDSMDFRCGRDVVAFQDPSDHGFKVFSKGEVHDVETIMPVRYIAGRDMVVYVDRTGALKVFENGKVHTAMEFEPEQFVVQDNMVVIIDKGRLSVFVDGTLHEVTPFVPERWVASWGALAYLDPDATVMYWRDGKADKVTVARTIRDIRMERGLLTVEKDVSTVEVWWNGKLYTH